MGPFQWMAVAAAALPITVVAVLPPWRFPWYAAVPALSGELLGLFAAGQSVEIGMAVIAPFTLRCQLCRGRLILDGRTYDPHAPGDNWPTTRGALTIVLFVATNAAFWWAYTTGRLIG